MSIMGLLGIIAVLFIIIIALAAFAVITFPVSKPYFQAAFSKSKYAILLVHKNGAIEIQPAQFRNSRAVLSNGLSKFIKQGLHGSYTLGSIKVDLVHSEVAPMIEDSTLGVFSELEKLGIRDLSDLLTRVNRATLLKLGLINRNEISTQEYENVQLARRYYLENVTLLAPAVRELRVHDMVKNCQIDPQSLAADTEENLAIIAKQYRNLMGSKKDNTSEGGINMKLIIIICIVLVIGALAVCFFMN